MTPSPLDDWTRTLLRRHRTPRTLWLSPQQSRALADDLAGDPAAADLVWSMLAASGADGLATLRVDLVAARWADLIDNLRPAFAAFGEACKRFVTAAQQVGLYPEQPPTDPAARALWLRKRRNTGPPPPPLTMQGRGRRRFAQHP